MKSLFDSVAGETQAEKILNYLREYGDWVSAWRLMDATKVLCYTRRMTDLRRAGHNIEMRWHVNSEGRKDYTEYRLVSEPQGR
jgi:hypothetical protein